MKSIATLIFTLVLCTSAISTHANCCQADFDYYAAGIAEFGGTPVKLTNTSTGCFTSQLWEYGDGDSSIAFDPFILIRRTDTMLVCLTVFDESGTCYDKVCRQVNVFGLPLPCYDSSLITTTPCQIPLQTVCGCDGNQYYSGCDAKTKHGITAWYVGTCPPDTSGGCTAKFIYTVDGQSLGLQLGQSYTGTSFLWDFGDGSTDNTGSTIHEYTNPGTYTVCLTTTKGNCTSKLCKVINVPYNKCYSAAFVNAAPNCPTIVAPVCGCNGVTYNNYCEANAAGTIYWTEGTCQTTGISRLQNVDLLHIYPNPFSNEVHILVKGTTSYSSTLWITDLSGKRIATLATNTYGNSHTWNADNQPAGYYLLHIEGGGQHSVEKLLLVR